MCSSTSTGTKSTTRAILTSTGTVRAAAVSSGTLNAARHGEVLGPGNLRILHKTGRIPYDALCVTPAVPESGARKIAAAFGTLDTRTARGHEALRRARGLTGWIAADDAQYDVVRAKLSQVEKVRWRSWKIGKKAQTEEDLRDHLPMFAVRGGSPATSTGL